MRNFSALGFSATVGRLILVLLSVILLGGWSAGPALAQRCTADSQCSQYPGQFNQCLGDTLILRRSICSGGQCQTMETGRQNCAGGGIAGASRCIGNVYVRSGGRCDALSGRCSGAGGQQIACVKSCSCRGNRLTVSTGTCTPGGGCGQAQFRCTKGCTCSPEPRCLEDPAPARRR